MGAEIYEVHAKGMRGECVMCHLVKLGAHDGHGRMGPYELRKVKPANLEQGLSWFKWNKIDSDGAHEGHPRVGQIFFPYSDKSIDQTQDVVVLNAVIAHYRFVLGQNEKVELEFVGHADSRGAAAFNDKLALQRAEAVRKHVDRGIRAGASTHLPTVLGYKSKASSRGESDATGNPTFDRRVDIIFRSVTAKQFIREDETFITGKSDGRLTKTLLFRPWGGVGLPTPIPFVGLDVLEIEIKNPNTGRSAFYQYMGPNVGISPPKIPGVSFSRPLRDFESKPVPAGFVDVDDFEGTGSVSSAMIVGGGQVLVFNGPKITGSKKFFHKNGVEFAFTGWDIQIGASVGGGYWKKMPYTTPAGRADALDPTPPHLKRHRERNLITGPKI
jgi:hypothetical protein